jgi:fatty-acyl-CoA synthase
METPLVINDFLNRAELVYGDRVAVVDEPDQPASPLGPMTYREMAERARGQAAYLDDISLGVGGRVAIISQNSARLLTSFFGVSGSGRILVPINFRLTTEEIEYIVEHSGARVLLADPELAGSVAHVDVDHFHVLGDDDDKIFPRGREALPWEKDERATATINYTSGTTARPKGVLLTHRNLWINATVFSMHASVSDRDVYLHTLPQFHCNGWGMVYGITGVGGQHIILRKVDGQEILTRVAEHGVTFLCGAPAVVSMVLDAAKEWDGPIPGHGRTRIVVAGAPPPTSVIEAVETTLGWEFIQIYGLTETAPLLTMNRQRQEWDGLDTHERARLLSRAGAPVLGTELLVDHDGEVLARSNTVLASYWEQPEASSEALAGGWFHTGDGGTVDEMGYVTITDRKKDVIISGGENVSSIEVEDALLHHPQIKEVAVIGIPDEKWGELVTALIVTDGSQLDPSEIQEFARQHLPGFKIPRKIEFRDELARTATGKLQKAKLREPYWAGRDRKVS